MNQSGVGGCGNFGGPDRLGQCFSHPRFPVCSSGANLNRRPAGRARHGVAMGPALRPLWDARPFGRILLTLIFTFWSNARADLKWPVHPYPRTEISIHTIISHNKVIEPSVEFDSLARPQAPNLVLDLCGSHNAFSTCSQSDADFSSN